MTEHCRIADIAVLTDAALPVVRVVVASVEGSAPREAGAAMLVSRDGITGTIGGGQLEFEAIAHARALLRHTEAKPAIWSRDLRSWPLGPSLGQCCGGAVRILFEHYGVRERQALNGNIAAASRRRLVLRPVASGEPLSVLSARQQARDLPLHVARAASDMLSGARPRQPVLLPARKGAEPYFIEPISGEPKSLFIYGAGHVGRAIVRVIVDLDFEVNWVDVHADRFPNPLPGRARPIITQDPTAIASAAPEGAYHLVLTFSHALDLVICHALLAQPIFGFLGLIGSDTKRARFMKRLGEAGIPPGLLSTLTCPIGIGALRGKEPATIAISVAAQLIQQLERESGAHTLDTERKLEATKRLSA
jgi:xanthine dehydrogenase accessory factor